MCAWEGHEHGWKQKEIATALGGSSGAVGPWFTKAKPQGVDALQHQSPPGRPGQRSPEQMAQWPGVTARVADMVRQPFGVSAHRARASHLLRRLKRTASKESHNEHTQTRSNDTGSNKGSSSGVIHNRS